eukprot:112606_1
MSFVQWFDPKGTNNDQYVVPRLLLSKSFIEQEDHRLSWEAVKMTLITLRTGEDIGRYFAQKRNEWLRCYNYTQLFVHIFEYAVSNPWPLMKEAMLAECCPLSILFNGNREEEKEMNWTKFNGEACSTMTVDIDCVFDEMIDIYFDKSDSEWMANVLYQLMNCCIYFIDEMIDIYFDKSDSEWMANVLYQLMNCCIYFIGAMVDCENDRDALIKVLLYYIKREMEISDSYALMDSQWFGCGDHKYNKTFAEFKWALARPMCVDLTFLRIFDEIKPPPTKKQRIK